MLRKRSNSSNRSNRSNRKKMCAVEFLSKQTVSRLTSAVIEVNSYVNQTATRFADLRELLHFLVRLQSCFESQLSVDAKYN